MADYLFQAILFGFNKSIKIFYLFSNNNFFQLAKLRIPQEIAIVKSKILKAQCRGTAGARKPSFLSNTFANLALKNRVSGRFRF
jgi:hypothetical protein